MHHIGIPVVGLLVWTWERRAHLNRRILGSLLQLLRKDASLEGTSLKEETGLKANACSKRDTNSEDDINSEDDTSS